MGYYSELDIEFREQGKNPFIADVLGLSYEELLAVDYEFYTEVSNSGLIYTYRVVFNQNTPEEILAKIDRLEGFTAHIKPHELSSGDYYQRGFELISKSNHHLQSFEEEVENLKRLNLLDVSDKMLTGVLRRQICIGLITALETFLGEVFITLTASHPNYFRKFVETHPEFKKRKFELRDIFSESEKINETGKKVMLDTIYHNLPVVKNMYEQTLDIEFPKFGNVYEYIMLRHDLVHRKGRTKNGRVIQIQELQVEVMADEISEFVKKLAVELDL